MNLSQLQAIFAANGCSKIYVKKLSANDNSKNQVYLGGSFQILNVFPISNILTEDAGEWNRERFKASLNFSWIAEDGNLYPASNAQLILYPKYPEVRFSGFLVRCEKPPSELMTQRLADRLLFLAATDTGKVIGFVCSPLSTIFQEFNNLPLTEEFGVFSVINLQGTLHSKQRLIDELRRIHDLGWITSKRLDKTGAILPCLSPNCGGYTLEAELGITPNGFSEPDFLGWEIKQFGVTNFERLNSAVITLMTPEPNSGFYISHGAEAFIHKYGYDDKLGRSDRKNFGGIHKSGERHITTGLKLKLIGYEEASGKISNVNGMIALVDSNENTAASWSFSSLLLHWNRKHNQACYLPSLSISDPDKKYMYANKVILGIGTDFQLFLQELAKGNIYYDPGIKLEKISSIPKIKKRSQFRIKSNNLRQLYFKSELITL